MQNAEGLQTAECRMQIAACTRRERRVAFRTPLPPSYMYKTKDRYVYFTFYPDPPIPERSCRMQISECKSDLQCCIHGRKPVGSPVLAISSPEMCCAECMLDRHDRRQVCLTKATACLRQPPHHSWCVWSQSTRR